MNVRSIKFFAALLLAGSLTACGVAQDAVSTVTDATKSVVGGGADATAPEGWVTASGAFAGDSNHETRGTAFISRNGDGDWVVTLGEDFFHDGAPDPKVGLGRDGYKEGTLLGELQSLNGRQSYVIPASLDVADYNQVWIWCEKFNVALGHANLELL